MNLHHSTSVRVEYVRVYVMNILSDQCLGCGGLLEAFVQCLCNVASPFPSLGVARIEE